MNELDRIAARIAELHGSIRLRPTLETAAKIGELLTDVKASLPHGQWMPWLRSRCPHISSRTARVYMQVFHGAGKWQNSANLSINRFLWVISR